VNVLGEGAAPTLQKLARACQPTPGQFIMQPMPTAKPAHSSLPLWLGYVLFVIYGSLVPLKYKDRTFDDTWAAFQNIPFLNLGVGSRADWISNGVLYVPVGFLTAYLLTQTFQRLPRFLLYVPALAFSVALAVGVEFTQLYFPQRTVSLNDIVAECIGGGLGILLAARYAHWFETLFESFLSNSKRLKTLALDAYVFGYFALVFFPYDFFISWPELAEKVNGNAWGWLLAGSTHSAALVSIQLIAEATLTLPFGVLLASWRSPKPATYIQAALTGLLLGCVIESVQFFMATGITQGLSVLTRVAGVCGGLALCQQAANWPPERITAMLRRYTLPGAVAYVIVLLEINGFFTLQWRGLAGAQAQFSQTNFTPFYYHYFTSEAKALFSLGVVALSYTPIAVLAWARGRTPGFAMAGALAVSTVIEVGKLFLTTTHPDPTNLLIASLASWFAVRMLQQLTVSPTQPSPSVPVAPPTRQASAPKTPTKTPPPWLCLCLASAGVWAMSFPAFPVLVAAVLATCAVLVWHKPVWAFAIIPAALPVFDLAPWSGRFFLDEFDVLLAVVLATGFARSPRPTSTQQVRQPADVWLKVFIALLAISFAISTARGLMPLQWPDANAFNNYYSPYNALRIAKGAVWAWLIFGLFKRLSATGVTPQRTFAWGMSLGLGLAVAVIIWERITFVGLWDFSNSYRVTGPFSAMHTGGAYIECFLAAATPFLVALMFEKRNHFLRLAGAALLLATTYALMVTFSRNGYFAFGVAVLLVLAASLHRQQNLVRSSVVMLGLAIAMLLIAVPIYKGEFAQSRMATVDTDLGVRQAHWADALSQRDPDWATQLFGMGLGRYPVTNYWRGTQLPRAGTYSLANEANNTFLRLGSGDALYVEQFVAVEQGRRYQIKLDVRASQTTEKMSVSICEKLMLTSINCIQIPIDISGKIGTWHTAQADLIGNNLAAGQRPTKLSLSYTNPLGTVDIDKLQLSTDGGPNLLQNSDFSAGLDNWFFAVDGHLQWHIKSLFVGLLFDQGWLGLLAVAALLTLALVRAGAKAHQGSRIDATMLAALSSFIVVGLFDTLIDTPRFLMLLLVLAAVSIHRGTQMQN